MKLGISLSVDTNPDYYFYKNITEHVWRQFGFQVKTKVIQHDPEMGKGTHIRRTVTLSQTARLFQCLEFDTDYVATSDIDLIPLDKEFFRNQLTRTCTIGWDLCGGRENNGHIPISYINLTPAQWREVLSPYTDEVTHYEKEFTQGDWIWEWCFDQEWLTKRILQVIPNIHSVPRGHLGRVDRSDWRPGKAIDSHLLRDYWNDDSWKKITDLLRSINCHEDWMEEERETFKRMR